MKQPVPDVSQDDVERIILRDFDVGRADEALAALRPFDGHPRVQLAILKLADGDLGELQQVVKIATEDWRDVIAYAEYPRYTREVGFSAAPETIVNEIIDSDREQYEQWFR